MSVNRFYEGVVQSYDPEKKKHVVSWPVILCSCIQANSVGTETGMLNTASTDVHAQSVPFKENKKKDMPFKHMW